MSNPAKGSLTVSGFDVRTRKPASSTTQQVHANPLLNRLYQARGIHHADQLDHRLAQLLPFETLKDIQPAVDLLIQARAEQWQVLVVGDYDTDGATSTALAVLGLQAMGLNVQYLLPNRFEYGYGLSVEIVELALHSQPDLIVTVDNGIASVEGVAKAKAAGVKVLVTDHHLAGQQLPNADAMVNPNQPACGFPSKAACGCTVMFYVLIALRARLRQMAVDALPNLGQWLDLVALATIADVVPLDQNNRVLVEQGLARVRSGQCRVGIKALFDVAGRNWQTATASDFGFVVGPRLNAAGRLDDMTIGVRLLLCEHQAEAALLANELQALNVERRQIEASMVHDVQSMVANVTEASGEYSAIVYQPDWHEGVIGILASRVKDKLHKPVIAFSDSQDGQLKGSARSVPGVHLKDCLDWISAQAPDLLLKFGGHAMAAGLTIAKENLQPLRGWLDRAVEHYCEPEALTPQIWTDGELTANEISLNQAQLLEMAGPWGQAFPQPSFHGQWWVHDYRVLSDKHLKLTLQVGQQHIAAIAFNVSEACLQACSKGEVSQVKGVYQLASNHFRGQTSLQLMFNQIEVI